MSEYINHTVLNIRPIHPDDVAKDDKGIWAIYQDHWTTYHGDIVEASSTPFDGPYERLEDAEEARQRSTSVTARESEIRKVRVKCRNLTCLWVGFVQPFEVTAPCPKCKQTRLRQTGSA
jgi:hypothetical protein